MTLPAVITLTQAGLTPALNLVDGAIQPPMQPAYMSWLTSETDARIAGDAANAAAVSTEVARAKGAESALASQIAAAAIAAQGLIAITDETGSVLTDDAGSPLLIS